MKKKRLYNRINKKELKDNLKSDLISRITLSFYKYHQIADPKSFRDELFELLSKLDVLGRIYVANEGINGQISVPEVYFDQFKSQLYLIPWLNQVRLNVAIEDNGKSFYVLKIKLRKKIVADGLNDHTFDVTKRGTHLDAVSFNHITDQSDVVIVDMRNHYESEVGHFQGAFLPNTTTFREALPIVEDALNNQKEVPIVMYCTGGIRCEKASAYLKHRGFKNVYQLDGGIIEYARQVRELGMNNKFIGKNFVFDERLGERITEDVISHCHQCGKQADSHTNCTNDACHLLFIQCQECRNHYEGCCSTACQNFIKLSEQEQKILRKNRLFNGSKFGKGRYKSFDKQIHAQRIILE